MRPFRVTKPPGTVLSKSSVAKTDDDVVLLSEMERRLVREGLDELDKSKFATEDEVRAVFDKYRH